MRKLIYILSFIFLGALPAFVSANSLESYVFDDSFFSGSYSPEYYASAELHFAWNTNDFWGKIFFQDLKTIDLTQLDMDGGGQLYCTKQVRWFYTNTARGNRVRPLDVDSLAYLQSVDPSYNNLSMTGWFFICGLVDNWVYGYIQHIRKGETYTLVVWSDYAFADNRFVTGDRSYPATFLFENNASTGYLWDSYWWIAQVFGSWLDVLYACGDDFIDPGETCDDGSLNGSLNKCNLTCNGITTSVCGNSVVESWETCDEWTWLNGRPGHCNLACNGTISQGGGWGGWWWISCATVDCSTSLHSSCCTTEEEVAVQDKKIAKLLESTWFAIMNTTSCPVQDSPYSEEMTEAFSYAYMYNITSQCPITKANLNGKLLRKHAAKMVSQFAINVLGKKPDHLRVCEFNDMGNETPEMKYYAKLACKLGIMWL